MNKIKTYKPEGVIRILPNPTSSGVEPFFNTYYHRKSIKDILDSIDFNVIERYVRKKKIQKIENL